MPPWNSSKAKVQLRLAVQRLRTLQQKKEAQAKSARRDIATILERSKIETARVKVENIINEDIHVELLELLELYCELLIARFGLLEQNSREPDPGIIEGVCCIIHAAPRTEVKELHILRDILMHKYGREFSIAVMENRDGCVSDRVMRKLVVATPSAELVDAYLGEIAKAYGVNWSTGRGDQADDSADQDSKDSLKDSKIVAATDPSTSDAETKTLKLPDVPSPKDGRDQEQDKIDGGINNSTAGKAPRTSTPPPRYPADDFDDLIKRFEALKKR